MAASVTDQQNSWRNVFNWFITRAVGISTAMMSENMHILCTPHHQLLLMKPAENLAERLTDLVHQLNHSSTPVEERKH